MKSWADHCSSDEESFDDEINERLTGQQLDDQVVPETENIVEPEPEAEVVPPPEKVYDFPERPPFTAFVGNLAYSVDEGEKLKAGLSDLAIDRLGEGQINVISGRVATDRNGRHRGFGYVEVESLDQLKALMTLNDGKSMIGGRKVQFDTANDRNNGNGRSKNKQWGPVDGSKFRGGRFSNGNDRSSKGADKAPAQRTTLKLAPRTKPIEGGSTSSSSDIFGGAKARDAKAWEKKRLDDKDGKEQRRRAPQNNAGRGSKGRGDGGRGGRGDKGFKKDKKQPPKPQETPEEKAAKAAAKATPQPAASAPAKKAAPINKFALLMDSDSE
eukprot:scaffold858_cov123-Cylindrotheca_fusiformis.AAC.17